MFAHIKLGGIILEERALVPRQRLIKITALLVLQQVLVMFLTLVITQRRSMVRLVRKVALVEACVQALVQELFLTV